MLPYSPLMAGKLIKMPGQHKNCRHILLRRILWLVHWAAGLLGLVAATRAEFSAVVSVSAQRRSLRVRHLACTLRVVPNMFDYQQYASAKPFKERLQLVFWAD